MSELAATPAAGGLHAAFRTDPGRVRANNEDLPLLDADRGIFGVIDGVGGHAAGELAAAIAFDVIMQRLARPLGTPAERAREAIALANNEIFKRAASAPELRGMTCVVTLAVVTERLLTVAHVGDTRLYVIRPAGIRKLTRDHSPVGEREDAGEMTEIDAMRHPRRHEVFRDVGSALRDKDEEDYVEIFEEPLDREAAILICSDGLTDMVPSVTIHRIVRQFAGNPSAVADALVESANLAGGRDNITVVYAEAPDFARAIRSAANDAAGAPVWAAAMAGTAGPSGEGVVDGESDGAAERKSAGGGIARAGRWVARSRTTWFALGALIGVIAALGLIWRAQDGTLVASRTLSVGPDGTGVFPSIAEAAQAARAGDVIRVEPGTYGERVWLADGVSLVARVPGSVTIVRPPVSGAEWIAVTTFGDQPGRISGIRVESTSELPVDVGIRVSGQSRVIDLVELAGPMRVGVEVLPGASAAIHGSQLAVHGTALAVGDRSQALVTGNVFLRPGPRTSASAVSLGTAVQGTFKHNLFAGYGGEIVKGLSAAERQQFASANVIVTAEPSLPR